ncbi:hypothetical protein [Metabacillus fastidiosus]|uniref:hypothetical protein n=1 Tax=Metabacillus fastidiosus TaxID=1458 RepID=UPI002E24A441|nr:hypothetical protein [Metabacillus fastidiosus]
MIITDIELIQITWEGPYSLNELDLLQNNVTDYGIYTIYGTHMIYGKDVLLYIGKADQQTLGKRISQEAWDNTNDSNNHKIYVGRLHGPVNPSNQIWSKQIALAESLLIYVHKPAYNQKNISSIPDTDLQNIHILNWGDYRALLPEVSGIRWTSKLDETVYEMYKYEC